MSEQAASLEHTGRRSGSTAACKPVHTCERPISRRRKFTGCARAALKSQRHGCRHLQGDLHAAESRAAELRARLGRLTRALATAWSLSPHSINGRPSPRDAALLEVVNAWVRDDGIAAGEGADDAAAHALQRQVLVTELKADVAQHRSARAEAAARGTAHAHMAQNRDLIEENAALRRDKKLLREQLAAAEAALRALQGTAAGGVSLAGAAQQRRSGSPSRDGTAGTLQPIPEDAADAGTAEAAGSSRPHLDRSISGLISMLGSRVPPSRPASGLMQSAARPTSARAGVAGALGVATDGASQERRRRPQSASAALMRPNTAAARITGSQTLRRPHSSHTRARSSSGGVARCRPARVFTELLKEERRRLGALEDDNAAKAETIAAQQAQMLLLQSAVRRQIMRGTDDEAGSPAADELVFDAAAEGGASPAQSAAHSPSPAAHSRDGSAARGDGDRDAVSRAGSFTDAHRRAAAAQLAQGQQHAVPGRLRARPQSAHARSSKPALLDNGEDGGGAPRAGLRGSQRPTSAGGANMAAARARFRR